MQLTQAEVTVSAFSASRIPFVRNFNVNIIIIIAIMYYERAGGQDIISISKFNSIFYVELTV